MGLLKNIISSVQASNAGVNGVLGVDIGSSSMKVIQLQEKKGIITLVTYGEVQLGPYVGKSIGASVTLDPKQEQTALVDVIRESAVNAKEGVFAMPLSSSFVTNVSIEAEPEADIAALVRVEARKVIPTSLSEVTLDWAEVELTKKEVNDSATNRRNILIASIQNIALDRFNILMQFVGLSKPPTEIECFSTIRGLYSSDENDIAIVDIGAVSAKLYIARKGLLMRMYRIRAGGVIATQKIAEMMDIDFEKAEALKCSADRNDQNFADLKRAHDLSYDRAFREFNQVLREYENKTGLTISSVYLAGGGALFPGMDAYFKSIIDKEVVTANPFSKVAYPAFMEDTMKEIGPSFSVALGAALRAFE
jgi:type IV pilus assembly protein PilM